MVQLLDALHLREEPGEVLLPVIGGDDNTPILQSCWLSDVDGCRVIDHTTEITEASHLRPSVLILQESKAPVWTELGVPWDHEGQCDLCVLVGHDSPQQVLDHDGILVLPTTVIGMQVYRLLAQPMVFKKMMEHTYDGVGALPHVDSFIDQVVHLSGDSQHIQKMAHFLGVIKYMGPGC